MKCDKYMGMDVHQAMTVVAVLDAEWESHFGNHGGNRSGCSASICEESEWTAACDV